MSDTDNKLVTFASLKETVTRMKAYANQFEPRKEVVSKAKLTYSTNYIRAYCDYVATIPTTVRVTDDNGSVLLVTGSDSGSWRAVRLIKGETDRFHKVYYSNGYVYIQVDNDSMYTVFGGVQLKVFGSATGTEIQIENAADDTEVKSDIAKLNTDKQDKTDNTLTTTDKTITGAINEVNGNLLDTVGFSADYKSIILNRKSGLNPYTIPISAIINNASLTELKDIDSTDIGNGKTLVYDGATNKHKYVDSTGTDEFVKMDDTTDAHYLADLIDKSTIVNDNGVLKVKKLDGQEVTITEINYLKGLTMNVMDLVNAFANGGVKVLNTPLNTASELDTMDRTSFIDGISYIVYVLADETHSGAKTTYLCTKTSTTFFGNADSQRNFTTNPIDLANEVTGKLDNSHIDVDNLWTLLTINDTYKTLTTNNEIFGTQGAKAMYDELLTAIGEKADTTDLTTHTSDTDIHITSAERETWNNKANDNEVIKKTDIKTSLDENSTNTDVYGGKAIFDAIQANVVGKETVLYEGNISAIGTYTLADDVDNYDFIMIATLVAGATQTHIINRNSWTLANPSGNVQINHGNAGSNYYVNFRLSDDKLIVIGIVTMAVKSIVGYKFGQITVANTITNPAPEQSYSLDEQLTGGTWVDGKPIYRKTVDCGVLPNSTKKYVAHGINNIGLVIAMYGSAYTKPSTFIPLPFSTPATPYTLAIACVGMSVELQTSADLSAYTKSYVTIEYTKTTD